MSVQDLQDELIQDVLVATGALGNLYGEKREAEYEPFTARPNPEVGAPPPQAATFSILGRSCIKASSQSEASRHG